VAAADSHARALHALAAKLITATATIPATDVMVPTRLGVTASPMSDTACAVITPHARTTRVRAVDQPALA
jgi:ABC-type glycerol-3-phosphate transport system permease component